MFKNLVKLLILPLFLLSLVSFSSAEAAVYVRGYTKSNGTYVAPHYRSNPDGNFYNNWSTVGNVNPYTGKEGTKTSPSSYSYTPNYSYTYTAPVVPSCGSNQYYSSTSGKCVCSSGYVFDKYGSCISNDQECKNKYGYESSYYDNLSGGCMYCTGGRVVNKAANTCSCKNGFVYNTTIDQCISYNDSCAHMYGNNVHGDSKYCYCDTGYKWNTAGNACISDGTQPVTVNNQTYCPADHYYWVPRLNRCVHEKDL